MTGLRATLFALALLAVLIAASVVSRPRRPENADAPLLTGAQIPARVAATLERSCRDCHSNATGYPWYSFVAPIAWLINRDVDRKSVV